MTLLPQINEASGIPIDDLKKVIKKDSRIKQILSPGLDFESIQNPGEFLRTIKFFVLDNRHVLDFVSGRDYIRNVDKSQLKKLRELRLAELNQKTLDALQTFVLDVFREHSHIERSGMSPKTRKEVLDWVNGNNRVFHLSRHAQQELQSIPQLRPDSPTLLYRGLLFSAHDLRERKRYDGSLEIGEGLKFLRSVREGTRVVDLDWSRASSWSTSKEVALRFAQFSSANSNFEATLNWLSNSGKGNKIHGELGFLISTLARPEDILIDVRRLVTQAHIKHGDEAEFILKPGKYTCRISTKFSKADGEVDPTSTAKIDETLQAAVKAVKAFSDTWAVDGPWKSLVDKNWHSVDVVRDLRNGNLENFKIITAKSTKESLLEAYDQLRTLYHDHLDSLSSVQLETASADRSIGKIVQWISDTRAVFNEKTRHVDFKSDKNSRGDVKLKELSPKQVRETSWTSMADNFQSATKGSRFTDRSTASTIEILLKAFTGENAVDIHKGKGADQQKHIDKIISSFFKNFNLEEPPEREEAIRKIRSAFMAAERNASLLNKIVHLRTKLDQAFESSDEPST